MVGALESWATGRYSAAGFDFPTYRKGRGPGVIVIHELPGLTPEVIRFAEQVAARGFTVVLPNLFGTPGASLGVVSLLRTVPRVCVRREFTKLARNTTAPIASWLRALARDLHAELGGRGVGALGMCFTGGFALAMMVEPAVVAPVVAQPAVPFAIGRARAADLNLSPADFAAAKERAAAGCPVLGLQYEKDWMTGTRFDRLDGALGAAFRREDLPGKGHGTLTGDRDETAVDKVLAFFEERLLG